LLTSALGANYFNYKINIQQTVYSYNEPNSNGRLGKRPCTNASPAENEAAADCWAENLAIAAANDMHGD